MANRDAKQYHSNSLGSVAREFFVAPGGYGDTDEPRTSSDVQGIRSGGQQLLTLGLAAVTLEITTNSLVLTGDGGGNTLATITGGIAGVVLRILFVDALVTITDDNGHATDSVDLSGAFTSADDTVLTLYHDGTSWYECSRSVN